MRLTVDLNSENVVSSPGVPQLSSAFSFKRNEVASFEVQFARNGQIVELDDTATGVFEIKASGKYDSEPLSGSEGWAKFGSGVNTYYLFQFSLINDDIDALLAVNADPDDDVASVVLMGEIQWEIAGIKRKTQTLAITVTNNVIRTGDVIPGGGAPPDYVIDDLDPENPQFVIEDDTLLVVTNA